MSLQLQLYYQSQDLRKQVLQGYENKTARQISELDSSLSADERAAAESQIRARNYAEAEAIIQEISEGETNGVIIDNKYIVTGGNVESAQQALKEGNLLAGTVVAHEVSHAIDSKAFTTTEQQNNYALNLAKWSESNIPGTHNNALNRLQNIGVYNPNNSLDNQSDLFYKEYAQSIQDELPLRQNRKDLIHQTKSAWLQKLSSLDHEDDDEGTVWNKEARERDADRMSPRQAWRAIQAGMPDDVIISSDIGNNCAIGNAYPTFEKPRKYLAPGLFGPCGYGFPSILGAKIGCPDTPVIGFAGDGAFGISMNEMSSCAREEWPAITMVIFRNYQWGAEKRNTTLWFDNNFVGTELDPELSYAKVADACGLKGVTVRTMEETTNAIKQSCEDQKKGITTFIEVILNQELGEPFRRDAMKKPVRVAGIKKEDMKKQPSLNS